MNKQLAAFGLSERDLTKAELIKAKKSKYSNEELISKSFKKMCYGK